MHLVVEGQVEILKNGRVVQELGARSSVGGLAALTRDAKGLHAICVEDTMALEIDVDDMEDLLEDNHKIGVGVLGALAAALRDFQLRLGAPAMGTERHFEPVTHARPLHLVEKMFFIRKTSTFAETSIEALADLAAQAIERRYEPGAQLWDVGDTSDWSVLVMNGKIQCIAESGATFEYSVGYYVGGLDSLSRAPRTYRAEAAGDLRVLVLRRSFIFDVFEDHPDVMLRLMRGIATGMQMALERVAARSAEESRRGKSMPPNEVKADEEQ
jgi:CRP-like cAMP-binding protein